uniref:MIF4G domain-containing protein n=1 Tax=Globisporangium ultimum (strain ATCC 200006 / CBS 805.95 / DAOM BR144) TaxID=431595 RepID=K3XA48_GLOUD
MERNADAAAVSGDKQDDAPLAEQQQAVVVDPQSLAQFDELQKQLSAREELRAQNAPAVVDALRAQIAKGTLKLKSDIKKSSAFVKKLKMLTENNADSVMKDIVELNLTRYVSECVASIAEAPLKIVDLNAAVKVISLLHQRYEEFSALMVQTLVSVFDASYGTEDKTKIVKRRIILRLLSELYLAGVYDDANVIVAIIQRVARREGGAPNKQRSKGANAASAGGSGSSSAQLEVPLLVSFAKSVGVEFLGVRPKKFKDLEVQLGDKFVTLIEKVHNMVPHAMQREALACFSESYEMICKFYLAQHATFVKLEARNEREEANRGEVSDAHMQELENAKLLFEKLQTSVNSLADALDREVPPLPLNKDDDGNGGGLSVWEGDGSSRAMRADSPFDDEDTRSFYEDLPDLLVLVPAVVLGLTEADVAELKKKREASASAPSAAEEEAEVETEAAGDGDADEAGGDEGDAAEENDDADDRARSESETAMEGESKPPAQESSSAATSASSTTSSATGAAGYHHQHDSYFSSLEDLVNRDRCDKAAVDFCYRNSKANRSRLIKTLFSVPRTHLELLAYYARLVATLQSVFKEDIGGELVNMLVNEFTHHIKKRNQFRLESKIKNIRFLAELVKFKICPPNVGFRCLKKCFDDFQGHNVLVATTFLENCGRFLYYSKHTHVRTENFLSIMMKLKSAKNLDPQAETLVQNAYYMCKPPERVERAVKQYDPLYLFIMKCLYQDLNETNVNKVVKTLRKLPWLDKTTTGYVLKAILKVTKGKVMHMKLICEVVKGLARYHDELPILLIDDVLEIIRRGLQINDYRDHQHSLGVVKLLGELYNSALVNMNVVLETLYLIINHSHDLLMLPEYSGASPSSIPAAQVQETKRHFQLVPDMRFDPRVPSDVDGPTEVFRIRLVCALVDACNGSSTSSSSATGALAERGISKARLGRFMVFFQRYIFSKTEIPLETDFVRSP